MKTKIVHVNELNNEDIYEEAAMTLRSGGLVAFPTETVYGIGAYAMDSAVVKKIYVAKGRPSDNPLIVHVGSKEDVYQYVSEVPEVAKTLMDAFWPGPLTLIFKKNGTVPEAITGGLDTVAIRVPSHPVARGIIHASGLPIAAPSANLSGKPSPTIAKHVIEDLEGRVDMIVDGGDSDIGLESTVLDVTQKIPMILRPGGITKEMLLSIIPEVVYDPHLMNAASDETPRAPGMKYRHYAPEGNLEVIRGSGAGVIEYINHAIEKANKDGLKTGVIATREDHAHYRCDIVLTIGSKDDPGEIAGNLFRLLREMDEHEVDVIFIRAFSEEAIGTATMNRLMKAAGNRYISIE